MLYATTLLAATMKSLKSLLYFHLSNFSYSAAINKSTT